MIKRSIIGAVALIILGSLGGFVYHTMHKNDDSQQRRIQLLEDALAPRTAEGAAYSWAEAVKERNGAWQYAVMDNNLRAQYYNEFEAANWVTGFSSPWVEKYNITRQSEDDKGNVSFQATFDWFTSSGYAYSNKADLTVSIFDKESVNERWLLSFLNFNYEPEQ